MPKPLTAMMARNGSPATSSTAMAALQSIKNGMDVSVPDHNLMSRD
jgi:hypothetical protein